MLSLVDTSGNLKTGNMAQTYRSGRGTMFATCPATCALNPDPESSTAKVDTAYLDALLSAVPRRGLAFAYTHFPFRLWAKRMLDRMAQGIPTTVINYSADSKAAVKRARAKGIPCVTALPADKVPGKTWREDGIRYVRCPAEYGETQCVTCGGDTPLCARADRDYVIVFTAHGASKKRVGTKDPGGCYAAGGNTALHWRRTSKRQDQESDGNRLLAWVRKLRAGSVLRHHIAGDIGLERV